MSDAFAGMEGVFKLIVVTAAIGFLSLILGLFILIGFIGNWLLGFLEFI